MCYTFNSETENLRGFEMDIELFVNGLLHKMKECGIDAKVTYCIANGEIISFEIKIIGYLL